MSSTKIIMKTLHSSRIISLLNNTNEAVILAKLFLNVIYGFKYWPSNVLSEVMAVMAMPMLIIVVMMVSMWVLVGDGGGKGSDGGYGGGDGHDCGQGLLLMSYYDFEPNVSSSYRRRPPHRPHR